MDWKILTNDLIKLYLGLTDKDVKLSNAQLQRYVGLYEVVFKNVSHKMKVSLDGRQLYVEALNPGDRLPKVKLYATEEGMFYIKEASLRFEFSQVGDSLMLTTYNSKGKDADWAKIE